MNIELPKTKEDFLKALKMAFEEGQKSVEGIIKYERHGDMEAYASQENKYNFETWANKIWKYGKNKIAIDPKTCNHSYKSMHRMQAVRTQYQCTICKHITEL